MIEWPRITAQGYRYIGDFDRDYRIISGEARLDKYTLVDYFEFSKNVGCCAVVRIHKDRPVAAMLLMVQAEGAEKSLLIDMLVVDKKCRGQGFGKGMLLLAEGLAYKLGIKCLVLDSLYAAAGFYRKLGFESLSMEDNQEWGRLIKMKKTLD